MSHTSGPWYADGVRVVDDTRTALAFTDVMQIEPEICRANARLIAAAPELLEALSEGLKPIGEAANILHNFADVFDFYMDAEKATKCRTAVIALTAWAEQAHAAIAKAERGQ